MFNPAPTNGVTEERFHDEACAREAWRTNCFSGSGLGPRAGRLFRNKRAAAVSAGTTDVPARINAEMVAASRDLIVTLSAPVRLPG
jgi:hypothetical protein